MSGGLLWELDRYMSMIFNLDFNFLGMRGNVKLIILKVICCIFLLGKVFL